MMSPYYSCIPQGVSQLWKKLRLISFLFLTTSQLLFVSTGEISENGTILYHTKKNETVIASTTYNFQTYNLTSDFDDTNSYEIETLVGAQHDDSPEMWTSKNESDKVPSNLQTNKTATVRGLRVEKSSKPVSYENSVSVILADSKAVIRLFGDEFTKNTIIRFVTEVRSRGQDCDDLSSTKSFSLNQDDINQHTSSASIQLPPLDQGETEFYLCVRENDTDMPWIHQGPEKWIIMKSYKKWLPLWTHIILLVILLVFSGLFSGLNLGLMAIDRTELKIIGNTGSEKERRYAKKIVPLRDNGNYLLCSLLLGNVMVNSTLTILLDDLTSGLIAVIGSTLGIVIFGEIIPQAFCSRYGLAVGANTVWITKLTMALTFPLSFPVSFILDKILGEEIGNVYNRDRLKELIKVTQNYNDLEKDEVNVIEGVLKLSQSTCANIMTKLEDVYMLSLDSTLDFDTISEIMSSGYSRIPIYERTRGNVISILYTKDLAFVDPDDRMPLKTICEFYHNPCNFVEDTKPLDEMFKEFKEGNKGHMAFVQRIHISEYSDPYYEIIGLVTLEDVIEELIQAEINDETDVIASNRSRRRSRGTMNMMQGVGGRSKTDIVSPQMALAAFQYLSASIEAFSTESISKSILERFLKQDIFVRIKFKSTDDLKTDPSTIIYERGKAADYFVLILEGRVQAEMGKENLVFESGPFTYFGTQSLNQTIGMGEAPMTPIETRKLTATGNLESMLQYVFIPDYTVRAVTDITFLKISRSMYMTAKQATILERSYTQDSNAGIKAGDDFDEQIDMIIHGSERNNNTENNKLANGDLNAVNDSNNKDREKTSGVLGDMILSPKLLSSNHLDKPGSSSTSNSRYNNDTDYGETKNTKTYAAMKLDSYNQRNQPNNYNSSANESENWEIENHAKL